MVRWRSLWLVGSLVFVLHPACSGDDDDTQVEPDEEGLQMCCELGAICHEVGVPDPEKRDCHVIGHENDPGACRDNYQRCLDLCAPGGEGGEGGEPMEHFCQ